NRHIVTINKGSSDGVYNGQPVLDAFGLTGQVIQVSLSISKVLLISDLNHAIPVKVDRSGYRTIALGTGDYGRLVLQHVPHTADIEVGDLLITSGLGQRFPEGYPVGEVLLVEKKPGVPFARIDAATNAKLSRSGHVVLVWPEAYFGANSDMNHTVSDPNNSIENNQ
ncbi:MAG: rod shape-determining protein MreC, partial [Pseudomonadota bacterium]